MPWETSQAKLVGQLRREGRAGERVLQVIARVPRDMFVPELQRHLAFADEALSILENRSDIALLFSDIQMPGSMDGLKLAYAVHARWPAIKIIFFGKEICASRNS